MGKTNELVPATHEHMKAKIVLEQSVSKEPEPVVVKCGLISTPLLVNNIFHTIPTMYSREENRN